MVRVRKTSSMRLSCSAGLSAVSILKSRMSWAWLARGTYSSHMPSLHFAKRQVVCAGGSTAFSTLVALPLKQLNVAANRVHRYAGLGLSERVR